MRIFSHNRILLVTFILAVLFSFNLSIPQLVQSSEAYPSVYVSETAAKNNPFYKTERPDQIIYDYFPSSEKKQSDSSNNDLINQLINSLIEEKVAIPEICGDGQDNDGNGQVDESCNVSNIPQDDNQSPQVEPEQEICGDGQDNDGNGQVDESCNVSNIPQDNSLSNDEKKNFDKFGVLKIYPTKEEGEQWYLKSNPNDDPRFSSQTTLTKNSDGSFKVKSSKVRMGVFTSSGFDPEKINTLNHNKIALAGYMQSPNDWRDVEITGYIKLNSGDNDNFVWYARGGRHTGSGPPQGCEGVAYKGGLFYGGSTRLEKEQWHVSYVFGEYGKNIGLIKGKWVGLKVIMYNIVQNDKTAVKLELWVDKNNNNNWIKAAERIDKGGWGNTGSECGGKPDQIITWGGPIAAFRWDGATNVDINKFSVREIVPDH
jgi:Putative metal-binding motif